MFDSLLALLTATALLLGSPGPAPLALAATGASAGIRRGLPFLAGILLGLAAAIVGASLGLAALFAAFPNTRAFVQILGALYIVYVAYKIATGPVISDTNDKARRLPGFRDGFLLNLLNPKAYAAFLAIFSQFLLPLPGTALSYAVTGLVCLTVGILVDCCWLGFGALLRPLFTRPKPARILRVTFAIAMLAAVAVVLVPR